MRILTVLVYLAALVVIAGCSNTSSWEKAMEETKPGMSRSEVVAKLTAEAWYYQPCQFGSFPIETDLFFFDSHQYDRARIVIVDYVPDSTGNLKVDRVSTFDDYAWHAPYADCVQRDKFED